MTPMPPTDMWQVYGFGDLNLIYQVGSQRASQPASQRAIDLIHRWTDCLPVWIVVSAHLSVCVLVGWLVVRGGVVQGWLFAPMLLDKAQRDRRGAVKYPLVRAGHLAVLCCVLWHGGGGGAADDGGATDGRRRSQPPPRPPCHQPDRQWGW